MQRNRVSYWYLELATSILKYFKHYIMKNTPNSKAKQFEWTTDLKKKFNLLSPNLN